MVNSNTTVNNTTINNNNSNNTNNTNNTINITINLRDFNSATPDFIYDYKEQLLNNCLNDDAASIIEMLHCNHDHPEYHNVRIKSEKDDIAVIFTDGMWKTQCKEKTLDQLADQVGVISKDFVKNYKEYICKESSIMDYDNLKVTAEDIYDVKDVRKKAKKEIMYSLVSFDPILHYKEKSRGLNPLFEGPIECNVCKTPLDFKLKYNHEI